MSERCKGIPFTKMHGAGNDYVYINALEEVPENLPLLSRQISNRHYGVGSDGLVAIMHSSRADFRMRMFNADGSEAEMCGNASRCIGKYVYEKGLTDKNVITLDTLAGIKTLRLTVENGSVRDVTVDMGVPTFVPAEIPVDAAGKERVISEKVEVDSRAFELTAVGMGNPHGVIFTRELSDDLVGGYGPSLENADIFPARSNIEFVRILDRSHIEMRVWERGSGETMACGTGACAAVAAGVANGLLGRHVSVKLLGGTLEITWDGTSGHIFLKGNAVMVADGVYYPLSAIEAGEV